MTWLKNIVEAINQCPEYIGKGILQLLILTLGGIIVAWATTAVFGRRSEINVVKGKLLKRKLEVYEELCGKLESLKAMVTIPSDLYESAVKTLMQENVMFDPINQNQILSVFDTPANFYQKFLETDNYISLKRLYFDNEVMLQTLRFQNYFAALRRLQVVYEEQFVDAGIPIDRKDVSAVERMLMVEIGVMLQDDFVAQVDKTIAVMKQSFKNLNFDHRDEIDYPKAGLTSPDGPVMSELLKTRLFSERELIMKIVTQAVAVGIVDAISDNIKK